VRHSQIQQSLRDRLAAVEFPVQAVHNGRTTLIIAHRFSTLRKADRIVVVEEGRIVGQGSHQGLIAGNPTYQRLYQREWAEEALLQAPAGW
jgi:ABC-type multidrug transport system fused ATPase/permease subunit